MRSIICISVGLCAGSAGALPEPGCYVRVYGERHLAENPDQVVAAMRLRLGDDIGSSSFSGAEIEAVFADQGHAVKDGFGGRVLSQSLLCWERNGATGCGVECDGGTFDILRQEDGILEIRTESLTIGRHDDCGGTSILAEAEGDPVTYRLFQVADAACEGFWYDER
ncbi:hypothetical protein AAD018_012645 [Aestuariibius insulae]|uniref:hypothetical protein n=1 Tax=Aestuariibius insulae TaxID=2058287 RepID=UPI00345E1B0A